jgi:hypothetical protein
LFIITILDNAGGFLLRPAAVQGLGHTLLGSLSFRRLNFWISEAAMAMTLIERELPGSTAASRR